MPITVDAIVNKDFKIKGRGFDPDEVNGFLDEICDTIEALEEENRELKRSLEAANRTPAYTPIPAPAAVPAPAPVADADDKEEKAASESAQKLLLHAQRIYDEMVEDARAEAEDILNNAKARAELGLKELEEEKEALQQEVTTLKDAARDYRERFKRLVDDQAHVLKAESELF